MIVRMGTFSTMFFLALMHANVIVLMTALGLVLYAFDASVQVIFGIPTFLLIAGCAAVRSLTRKAPGDQSRSFTRQPS